jgi:uncharacterized protein (TIGR02118 family)
MIKVSVLYPHTEGSRFDVNYYRDTHIPMIERAVGTPLKAVEIEQGLAGGAPGTPPPYVCAAHMYFDSVESFQQSFMPHAATIRADVRNYTDIKPVMQIAQVLKGAPR